MKSYLSQKDHILFIQPPLNDHGHSYILGNVEYAGAALAGYIRKKSARHITSTLPFLLSNFASDQVIARYVSHLKPDIVCFSSYLWNLERNLHIAHMIKIDLPETIIIFGGSEISRGSFCFQTHHDQVDIFLSGEGEWFFNHFLQNDTLDGFSETINGNRLISQPPDSLVAIDDIVEPFTANMLNTMTDRSIFLELTRGCPYRCSYCYYSRNCPGVRELPFELLTEALQCSRNLSEIYILSPTFDRSKDFHRRLETMKMINHGISLHSEMRAGSIDRQTANLLYSAGFRSMEVGLQTLNSDVLKRVRRGSDTSRELEGMRAMKDAGIDLKIGIIPGLPGETPDSFVRTIDTLIDRGFEENIELYPLMILPGTVIREQAIEESVHFQMRPPYFYLDGWGMSYDDITAISSYAESKTGFSPTITGIPDFTSHNDGLLIKGVRFNGDISSHWNSDLYVSEIETSVFSFHIYITKPEHLYRGLSLLLTGLPPHNLYNVIIYSDSILDEGRVLQIWKNLEEDTFHGRNNVFNAWKEGQPWRIYQILERPDLYERAFSTYGLIEPVLSLGTGNIKNINKVMKMPAGEGNISGEHFLLVRKGALSGCSEALAGLYHESMEMISFEDAEEQSLFYNLCGYEHVELPFTFRVIDHRK